jgi:hypothetical protein
MLELTTKKEHMGVTGFEIGVDHVQVIQEPERSRSKWSPQYRPKDGWWGCGSL